ncbi:uncharacterized protein LOC135161233 isoform X1 [Diachasmimorpha longicaudata]|uniref:uncharacterized protein LOC135161233 isoform X1 n=1 Tax=Diachasmimorpha longicaudata TaxID=58733 RepID=UPI0030B8BE48
MSKAARIASNSLSIGENSREITEHLIQKDKELSVECQQTFFKVKQYQYNEVILLNNNSKLKIQSSNLGQEDQGFIDAIAEKTTNIEESEEQIRIRENENELEQKDIREARLREAIFYARMMIESQDEYKTINLKNDINYYEERRSAISFKINDSINAIKALMEVSKPISLSQELTDISDLYKLLRDDEEPLIREMRSKDSAMLTLIREIKQIKVEISQVLSE